MKPSPAQRAPVRAAKPAAEPKLETARALVDEIDTLLASARKQCDESSQSACEPADKLELELISATTAYLQLLDIAGGDPSEARSILAAALSANTEAVVASLNALRARGLSAAETQEVLDALVGRLGEDTHPEVLLSSVVRLVKAAPGKGSEKWTDATLHLVGALAEKGLSEPEATKLVARILDAYDADPDRINTALELAKHVRNPKVLAVWNANLQGLLGAKRYQQAQSRELKSQLEAAEPDPDAILKTLLLMTEAEQKAMARFAASVAEAQERLRSAASHGQLRTPGNMVVIVASKLRETNECNPAEVFQLGLEQGLTRTSLGGVRPLTEIPATESQDAEFEAEVAAAVSECRGQYQPGRQPSIGGKCEGVLAVQIDKQGSMGAAEGTLHIALPLKESAKEPSFRSHSLLFSLGCDPKDRDEQIAAASSLLFVMQQRSWLFANDMLPVAVAGIPQDSAVPSPSLALSSLLSPGLPWLLDGQTKGNWFGVSATGADVALLFGTALAYSRSLALRYQYSDSPDNPQLLEDSKDLRRVGNITLAVAGALRVAAGLAYVVWRPTDAAKRLKSAAVAHPLEWSF